MMSSPPPKPHPPAASEKNNIGGWLSIAMTCFFAAAGFVVLGFLTMGFTIPILFIGVGMFTFVGLNYLIWGWWMKKIIRHVDDELEDD